MVWEGAAGSCAQSPEARAFVNQKTEAKLAMRVSSKILYFQSSHKAASEVRVIMNHPHSSCKPID